MWPFIYFGFRFFFSFPFNIFFQEIFKGTGLPCLSARFISPQLGTKWPGQAEHRGLSACLQLGFVGLAGWLVSGCRDGQGAAVSPRLAWCGSPRGTLSRQIRGAPPGLPPQLGGCPLRRVAGRTLASVRVVGRMCRHGGQGGP